MKIKSLIVFGVLGLLIIISGQALADGDDGHMGDGDMMDMDWWDVPFMGFWIHIVDTIQTGPKIGLVSFEINSPLPGSFS